MNVYSYHPITREFIGVSLADEDPLDKGNYLFPANSTNIEPPEQVNGKVRVFTGLLWQYDDLSSHIDTQQDFGMIALSPNQIRANEIIELLNLLDLQSVRPLRAIIGNVATDQDFDKLNKIESQSASLRSELASINPNTPSE